MITVLIVGGSICLMYMFYKNYKVINSNNASIDQSETLNDKESKKNRKVIILFIELVIILLL